MIQFSSTTPRKVALPFINILPRGGMCYLHRSEGVVRLLTLPPAVLLRPVRGLFLNYCQLSTANLRLEIVACDFEHFHDSIFIHNPSKGCIAVYKYSASGWDGWPSQIRGRRSPAHSAPGCVVAPRSGLVFELLPTVNCQLTFEICRL